MTPLLAGALAGCLADPLAVTPVDYAFGSPATGGLFRVSGQTTDGESWAVFCKVLHHVRHWPRLRELPPEHRDDFADSFPWRAELQLWDPAVLATFPDGLRAPYLLGVTDLGDDRIAVWQEYVDHDDAAWTESQFARAARLLGRWNARSTTDAVRAVVDNHPPGFALRMYVEKRVVHGCLPNLAREDLWTHPWLRDHGDLRAALLEVGQHVPALLSSLDAMVQCVPHGDASPQNLLFPVGAEDTLVAIDLSFRSSHALGFDLGQLLVGQVHADAMPASALAATARTILAAYVAGLHDEGITDQDEAAARGFATSAVLRSAFDCFRYDLLRGPGSPEPAPAVRASFDQRVALSRFLVDQFHSVLRGGNIVPRPRNALGA